MSKLKISEGVFLEKQELDRFQKFIFDEGFKKHILHNSINFGLIKNQTLDPSFLWGRIEDGTNAGTIKVNFTEALTKTGNVIVKAFEDNIVVPSDGQWYWIKLSHTFSDTEQGSVSIDTSGNAVGIGTKFTEILRGQPNFPSTISFKNSNNNLLDYQVVEVIDDNNLILAGAFTAETNLLYRTIGTFTPGKVPSTAEKGIYQYDNSTLIFVLETTANTKPSSFINGLDFALARVRIIGAQVVIEDRRNEVWETSAFVENTFVETTDNVLIGVESIRYDAIASTKSENILTVAWGMRSDNWTINTNLNLLTIQSGLGGKYKNTSYFNNGDFDNWRVYLPASGKYYTIISSVKSGSQINLKLDNLVPTYFENITQEIVIVPNAEYIEFLCTPDPATTNPQQLIQTYSYPIFENNGHIRLFVYDAINSSYNIQYRYRTGNRYTNYKTLPNDVIGYYNETAFDPNGILIDVTKKTPYISDNINGYITLIRNTNAYVNFVNKIDTGDIYGVTLIDDLENTIAPLPSRRYDMRIGVHKQKLIIQGDISIPLIGDVILNLLTADAKSGSKFYIHLAAPIDNGNKFNASGVNIIIRQDNITDLYTFTQPELDNGNVLLLCYYDIILAQWTIAHINTNYDGYDSFKEGSELIDLDTGQHSETVSSKNVLIVSGYHENITLSSSSDVEIWGIRVLNEGYINNINIENNSASAKITFKDNVGGFSPPSSVFKRFIIEEFNVTSPQAHPGTPIDNGVLLAGHSRSFALFNTIFLRPTAVGQRNLKPNCIQIPLNVSFNLTTVGTITNFLSAAQTFIIDKPCVVIIAYSTTLDTVQLGDNLREWSIRLRKNSTTIDSCTVRIDSDAQIEYRPNFNIMHMDYADIGDVYSLQTYGYTSAGGFAEGTTNGMFKIMKLYY